MAIPEHISHRLLQLLPKDPAMLVLDFDGVFTDDRVYVREDRMETVACTRKDGLGIALLRRLGFPVIVLSTEKHPIVTARAKKLQIECVQGCTDKTVEFERLLDQKRVDARAVVFVGNDVNDIGCLQRAGCGLVVADAHPMARAVARGALSVHGGHGAVREVAELILARLGHEIVFNPSDAKAS